MKRVFVSGLVLFFVLGAGALAVLAQNPVAVRAFDRVPLSGSDQLDQAISDPGIGVMEKRLAIARLGQLAGELRAGDGRVAPSRLFNPLLGVLTPQKSVQDHYLLREEACTALARFSELEGSEQLVAPLGKRLQDGQEREEVRLAAARSLGKFRKDSAAAADELIQALNREMERGPKSDNVNVATGIVGSLGQLRDRRSFVPLMRMVQSTFPNYTKRRAQEALESIQWQ